MHDIHDDVTNSEKVAAVPELGIYIKPSFFMVSAAGGGVYT